MSNNKRKILMASHLAEASGAPRVLVNLAKACHHADWDVTVVMPGDGELCAELREAGVKLDIIPHPQRAIDWHKPHLLPGALWERRKYFNSWKRWLKDRKFDVAYISSGVEVLRGLACSQAGLPVCWHIHEDFPTPTRALVQEKIDKIKSVSKLLIYAAGACRRAFEPIPQNLPDAVLWNGIDLNDYKDEMSEHERTKIRRELKIEDDEVFIATLAFVQPRKGIDVAMEAASILRKDSMQGKLPQFKWLIIGDEHPEFPDYHCELKSISKRYELENYFSIAGFRNDVPRVLRAADLFVLPSRNEAMPIAIVEAMAAGLPVISTDVGDVREMMKNGECGWIVPPEKPDDLAEAVRDTLTNGDKAQRLSVRARQRAFETFSIQMMEAKFLAMLENNFRI